MSKSQTPAMVLARSQAAEARALTPHKVAEIDEAKEGARLGRIVAEQESARSTLATIAALKVEGHEITPSMYVIGTRPDGEAIDAREVLAACAKRRQFSIKGRTDGRMSAAELSSVVTAAARNVTAGINRRTSGQGKVTSEDWEDLTGTLTLAALAREAEAEKSIRGDSWRELKSGRRDSLDTLPRWETVKAESGDSHRDAWVKALTANEGRTWAKLRAQAASASLTLMAESADHRQAAANEAAEERAEIAANEAAEVVDIAIERLGISKGQKAARQAAIAELDGLTTPERAKLNGRSVEAQKQDQKRGRRYLLAALGDSMSKARDLAAEAFSREAETLTADQRAESDLDTLAWLAESNRAYLARILADAYALADCEAERYLIMRAHYGAPVVKVTAESKSSRRKATRKDRGKPNAIAQPYRPRFTTADLAHLPERTPKPGNVDTLPMRAEPTTCNVQRHPVLPTNHNVVPTAGLPVKRTPRQEAPVVTRWVAPTR